MKRNEFAQTLKNLTAEELNERLTKIVNNFDSLNEAFKKENKGISPRVQLLEIRKEISRKRNSKFLVRD